MHKNNTSTHQEVVNGMDCWFSCRPLLNMGGYCKGYCFNKCPDVCRNYVFSVDRDYPSPRLPPPPCIQHQDYKTSKKHLISTGMTIVACMLGATLILGILSMIFRAYCKRQRNQRRTRSAPIFFGTQEDFADEEQGPEIDHPIWHINTVGLQQSVIDSIVVFKYNKGEGLVEGTECSVCLNDFQEDENLRLLPKCSHAFHLPCIDTWLRSHKNCPLCRAPIVSANSEPQAVPSVSTMSDLSSREEHGMGYFDGSSSRSVSNQEGEYETSGARIGVGSMTSDDETNVGNGSSKMKGGRSSSSDQVWSDLVDGREDVEAEVQPMRRSVSLDSSSALAIYNALSQTIPGKDQRKIDSQQSKHSRAKRVDKRGSTGSLSFRKLMKSSSIGRSLQRGPVSMKRSFSSSGKSLASGESTRQTQSCPYELRPSFC